MRQIPILNLLILIGIAASVCRADIHRWVERPIARPDFQAIAMIKGTDGRLIVASHDELFAFDGDRFEPLGVKAATGLFRAVVQDSDGVFWIAAEEGIFRHAGNKTERVFDTQVIDLIRIGKTWIGAVFLARDGATIVQFYPERPKWRYRVLAEGQSETKLHSSSDGKVYFSLPGKLCHLDASRAEARAGCEPLAISGTAGLPLEYVLRSRTGGYWARNYHILFRWDDKAIPRNFPLQDAMAKSSNLTERVGDEVCGIFGGSLRCWNSSGEWVYDVPRPLAMNPMKSYSFGDGAVWVAVSGFGLLGLSADRDVDEIPYDHGITGYAIDTHRLGDESLLAATPGGVRLRMAGSPEWRQWGSAAAPPRPVRIRRDGDTIGLATATAGLRSYDLAGRWRGSVERFDLDEGKIATSLQKEEGSIWLVGGRGGLFRADLATGFGSSVHLPRKGGVKDLDRMSDGRFAIAATSGLMIGKPGHWTHFDDSHGLRIAALQAVEAKIHSQNDNEYWVDYDLAIGFARIKVRGASVEVTNFGKAEGFDDLGTFDFLWNPDGRLSRGGGAAVYLSDGKHFAPDDWYKWTAKTGMTNPDVTANTMRLEGETLWVSTTGAIVRIKPPADLFARNYAVQTHISRVRVDGRETRTLRPLRVRRGERLEVNVSQLNLLAEPQLSYEYRLMPLDERWQRATDNKIQIENLSGGALRLEVRAHPSRFIRPVNVAVLEIEAPLSASAIAQRAALVTAALLLAGCIWLSRWRLLAWIPSNRVRHRVEKRLFLQTRGGEAPARRRAFRGFPPSVRKRVEGMLARHAAASPEGETELPPVLLAGRYVLEHPVARGATATVYFGRDRTGGAPVAVKLFHRKPSAGTWHARKLKEESISLERVKHRGIVRLLDGGESAEGLPYLVMEYIAGTTLRQELRSGALAEGRAIVRLREMLDALRAVHENGILHRDLKPENVMLRDAHTPGEQAVLIDFGVSYLHDALRESGDSTYEAWTPAYVAPEQTIGIRSSASDIYSVALIAFEMLSGTRFRQAVEPGGGEDAIRAALEKAGAPRAAHWAKLLGQATVFDHAHRTQSATAFLADMRGLGIE